MHIYVIFAKEDRVFFETVQAELAGHHINVITSSMLAESVVWEQAIADAIAVCDAVIVLLGRFSLWSEAAREVFLAEQSGKPFIAVVTEREHIANWEQSAPFSKHRIVPYADLISTLLELQDEEATATRGGSLQPASRGVMDLFSNVPTTSGSLAPDKAPAAEEPSPVKAVDEDSEGKEHGRAASHTTRPTRARSERAAEETPPPAQAPTSRRAAPPPQPVPTPSPQPAASAPPAPKSPPPRGVNVDIGGNVSGQVTVAGGDVHIHHTAPTEEETRNQPRKFEAAFPKEAHKGVEEKLWVAVRLPDAPSPFGEKEKSTVAETEIVNVPLPVDRKTGELKPIDVEVALTAPDFKIIGDRKKTLTVWPDGRTVKRWFVLEPTAEGAHEIMLEISHKGRLLTEIALEPRIYAPEKKARALLNLSLQIASFSLQVSFAGA